jgi:PKD repeat protein
MARDTTASPIHFPFFLKLILNKKLLTACCIFSVVALTLFGAFPAKAQTTTTMIELEPSNYRAHSLGENFTISITVTNVTNLWSWCVGISWDPNALNLTAYHEGPFLKAVGSTFWLPVLAANGTIEEMSSTLLSLNSANGTGVLATLTFTVMKETVETPITLFNTTLLAPNTSIYGSNPSIDHQVENATVTLILGNAPVANAGQDQTVNQGAQVVLNGSQTSSSDPNATYTWSFTDGTLRTLQGKVVNYTFNTPGTYDVTLFVQDSYGNSTDTTKVTVMDTTAPVARISIQDYVPGQAITVGQRVTFDGSLSTDLYSTIQYYSWDMGDGSPPIDGNPTPHYYSNPGTYNVTLTIIDAAGRNATATFTISVAPSNTNTSSTSLNLPTYLLGILSIVTILAFGGSVFWLRKPRKANEANDATRQNHDGFRAHTGKTVHARAMKVNESKQDLNP